MLFTKKRNFGVTQCDFLNEAVLGYVNLCKVRTDVGYTASDATSIDKSKKIALKKCYSEYLERYSLGIKVGSEECTEVIEYTRKQIGNNYLSAFAYGDHATGHNDTTGTAAGLYSDFIINKAICELVEKNEVFCFWYGSKGNVVEQTAEVKKIINKLGFISTDFFCFCLQEISNYPTILVLGFLNQRLITTGVSCTNNILSSLQNAFQEAKIVEWQQFQNPESNFSSFSDDDHRTFWDKIVQKHNSLPKYNYESQMHSHIIFAEWVNNIQIRLIHEDRRVGVKVIKCISEELLSCLPIKKNIEYSLNKEIVKRYYLDKEVDCPIV